MSTKRLSLLTTLLVAGLSVTSWGQVPDLPRPTPAPGEEEEVEYRGIPRSYDELATIYYQVLRLPKRDFVKLGDRRVRSIRLFTGRTFELVAEDGDYYLVRNLPMDDPDSYGNRAWKRSNRKYVYEQGRREYFEGKYDITGADPILPPFTDRLELTRMDENLPREGRWQMSFDLADMNGDGRLDLVLPPMRLGYAFPSIGLLQEDGSWERWDGLKWPADIKLDYGSVRVADFDLDGNLDIAIACHLQPSYVLYGNGKGDFTRWKQIPLAGPKVSSRSLAVADFNNDGRPDLALVAEVDVDLDSNQRITSGLVNVVLNTAEGLRLVDQQFNREIQADWLLAHDIDQDGWTDLLLTSRKFAIRKLIWRNLGNGERFEAIAEDQIPVISYVFANGVGHFDGYDQPDLVLCFEQFNWQRREPPSQACAVYHFHDAEGRPSLEPRPVAFLKVEEDYNNNKGLAVGDIDGDGRDDLAIITVYGAVRLLLQLPDHTLYEETSPEVDLGGAYPFDVRIADLNGDGRGEVIVMAATGAHGEAGGVWVYSPRPKRWPARGAATEPADGR